jgi:LCP family protein required for cell wall assembly
MSDEHQPDSFERYFRPGGPTEGSSGAGDAPPSATVSSTPRTPATHRRSEGVDARRQRRFLMVTGVVSSLVLLTSGVAWAFETYIGNSIGKEDVAGLGNSSAEGPHGAMNILVAGVDRREGLSAEQQDELHLGHDPGARSDTMMLVHLSADHSRISVVSLPRDSYVTIPAHQSNGDEGPKGRQVPARYGKLNWAYQFGGPDLTVATVKQATGLAIDHYVEVNFFGFVKMVDAVGGVDICTPTAINDPKSGLRLPAGRSHVDGVKALSFARARYTLGDGSDLGRIDRQQKFMATMLHKAISGATLADPVKSAKFLSATLGALTVDKGLARDLPKLADQMRGMSTNNVTFAKVPLSNPDFWTTLWNSSQTQSTVRWDEAGAKALFQSIKKDEPLTGLPTTAPSSPAPSPSPSSNGLTVPPDKITVRVRNGVGTVGLAKHAADDLRRAGFDTVVVPGVAERGLSTTIIEYGHARAESARTLAAAIPGARLREVASLGSSVQVIVGSDWSGARQVKVAQPAQPSQAPAPQPSSGATTATQNVMCG